MNEGWATFWHYTLLNTLYDEGHLTDGFMIEWLKSHTNVIYQPPVGASAPTAASIPMRSALRCTPTSGASAKSRPTKTASGSPNIAGTPTGCRRCDHAMRNFKDESFIGQYLSPKLMRDLRLFAILDDETRSELRSRGDPRRRRLPARARGAVAPVRPGIARAQHPGLERQPARRPLADPAPHPAQRPAAARRRARRC